MKNNKSECPSNSKFLGEMFNYWLAAMQNLECENEALAHDLDLCEGVCDEDGQSLAEAGEKLVAREERVRYLQDYLAKHGYDSDRKGEKSK